MVDPFEMQAQADMANAGGGAAPAAPQTTEGILGNIYDERAKIAAAMIDLGQNGQFGDVQIGVDDFGSPVMGASGDSQKLTALAKTFDSLGELARYGSGASDALDTTGAAGGLSQNTMAQIAQQDRQLAESMRQFDISTAQSGQQFADTQALSRESLDKQLAAQREQQAADIASQEKRAADALKEQQRGNNLSSTLDLLTNQIKVGDIGVNEATNRIAAATNAAQIQRQILADQAGKALPAGTTTFPNLGAGGPIAAAAKALGQPFVPFSTLGTFPIDPNAIAAPISSAPGDSMLPMAQGAVNNTARALAGQGVPLMAGGGDVSGPYISGDQGPELNVPHGDGTTTVFPAQVTRMAADPHVGPMVQRYMSLLGAGGAMPSGYPQSTPQTQPIEPPPMNGAPAPFQHWMQQYGGGGGMGEGQWASNPNMNPYMDRLRNMFSGRPEVMARLAQMLAGFGVVPTGAAGPGFRYPQVGAQPAANAMAGG